MMLPDFSHGVPRALALDLDGTALNSASRMSPRTAAAVMSLVARGFPVVIATARPERVIPVLVGEEISSACSIVQMGGAAGRGRHPLAGSVRIPIARDHAALAWEIVSNSVDPPRMTMEVDGHHFAVNHESDVDVLWNLNSATPASVMGYEEAMAAGPVKVSVNGRGRDLRGLVAALREAVEPGSCVIPAGDNSFINIQSSLATKAGAARQLLERSNISLEEVISFGDDLPDLDLMVGTGWPVAVENAISPIREAATYLTASNDDEGVALVLERLLAALPSTGAAGG